MLQMQRLWTKTAVVNVVRLNGQIADSPSTLNLARVEGALNAAYMTKPDAVALQINCPGGSAVQSLLLLEKINALRKEYGTLVPTWAFAEDVAASGGYMLLSAADECFATPASLVGSIGAVYQSFGLVGLLEKIGVERRVRSAGVDKVMGDPFSPQSPTDNRIINDILAQTHDEFIHVIENARGDRLAAERCNKHKDGLFSGRVWLGREAKQLGLIDGIGSLERICEERLAVDGKTVQYCYVNRSRLSRALSSFRTSLAPNFQLPLSLYPDNFTGLGFYHK